MLVVLATVWMDWASQILFGCLRYCLGGLGHCVGDLRHCVGGLGHCVDGLGLSDIVWVSGVLSGWLGALCG